MEKADFSQRNVAIDILRALTMFTMIFVNDFWKVHDVPHWLEHAGFGEDFMGLADIVFPSFLFAVGMSIPFALERRYSKHMSTESTLGHIFSRTFALLIMGAFISNSEARLSPEVFYSIGVYWILMAIAFICIWNQYPKINTSAFKKTVTVLKVIGWLILIFLALTFRSRDEGNVFGAHWGILGAIGWTYLVCALIYIFTRDRLKYLIPIWIFFVLVCIFTSRMNVNWGEVAILNFPYPNFLQGMLGVLHIGNGALPAFTMGGMILSILSVQYAQAPVTKKASFTVITVVLCLIAGFISRHFWVLSKIQSTPPWIFYVTAIAVGTYGVISWLVSKGKASWFDIIKPAGTATLTTYLIPYVAYAFADITGIILPDWFTHGVMGIVNCLCFSLVIISVTYLLGKIHIKLKV